MSTKHLNVMNHPLAEHFLTHLRDEQTKPALFRTLTKKLSVLLALEATKNLNTVGRTIHTPLEEMTGQVLGDGLVVIPILRAGLGMIESITDLFPSVSVGYVGIQRCELTAKPLEYYFNIPPLEDKFVMLIDPMLATGGSASHALDLIKKKNPKKIVMLSIISSPEGVRYMEEKHPDVQIFTAS